MDNNFQIVCSNFSAKFYSAQLNAALTKFSGFFGDRGNNFCTKSKQIKNISGFQNKKLFSSKKSSGHAEITSEKPLEKLSQNVKMIRKIFGKTLAQHLPPDT